MRYLVHLGLFFGALVAVTSAEAQPNRRADREVTLVVARHGHPKHHNSKHDEYGKYDKHHNSKHDKYGKYDKHHNNKHAYRVPRGRAYGHYKPEPEYRLHDERRDLRQIVNISRAWRRAVVTRDHYGQAMTDRRLEAWLDRELYDARRDHHDHHYVRRLRELRRELDALNWHFHSGYAGRHDYARKSRILDHLVELSERQVYRAQRYDRYLRHASYAIR